MEQWNNDRQNTVYDIMIAAGNIYDNLLPPIPSKGKNATSIAINRLLLAKYYNDVLKERNIPLDYIKNNTIETINADADEGGYKSFDNYKKTPARHLKKMLDYILGEDESKKFYDLKNRDLLTKENYLFFDFLIDFCDKKKTPNKLLKLFFDGKYHELEDSYVSFMYEGIIEFANNKDIGFDAEGIIKKWDMRLSRIYEVSKDIKDATNELNEVVDELNKTVVRSSDAPYAKDMLIFYEKAKEEINSCLRKLVDIQWDIFRITPDEELKRFIEETAKNFRQSNRD